MDTSPNDMKIVERNVEVDVSEGITWRVCASMSEGTAVIGSFGLGSSTSAAADM